MKAKYREPTSMMEIYSLFEGRDIEGAFLWQNTGDEQREKFMLCQLELHRSCDTLAVSLVSDTSVDSTKPVYLFHPHRKTISKTMMIAQAGRDIILELPKDIKTLDTRLMPRFYFRPSDEKFVTLQFDSDISALAGRQLNFQLIDISQSGLALCISHKNKNLFRYAQKVYLTHLGKVSLPRSLAISEVYLKSFVYKKRNKKISSNRAGFQIQGQLKKFVLEAFTS